MFTSEIRGSLNNHVVVVRDPDPRDLQLPTRRGLRRRPRGLHRARPGAGRRRDRPAARRGRMAHRRPARRHRPPRADRAPRAAPRRPRRADAGHAARHLRGPPGDRPRRVSRRTPAFDHALAFAGEHLVFAESGRLHVLDPGGRVRAFGIPTEELDGFIADGRRVLWAANDCLLVADVTDPVAAAPAAGPCPRTELHRSTTDANPHLGRTLPVRLRCVAAPSRCHGTPAAAITERGTRLNRPRRYSVPAGGAAPSSSTHRARLPRTAPGGRARGDAGLWIRASSDDGDRTARRHTRPSALESRHGRGGGRQPGRADRG